MLVGIVSVQFLLAAVWLASKMPYPNAVVSRKQDCVILTCTGESSPILMLLNVILSVIFMVSSTVLAFKTRHFPKNYNESKYVGITLYVTCVSWALFFPVYFFASSENSDFLRDAHSLRLNWIHHAAGFIWTEGKIAVVHFKRKVESEVKWTTEYQFFLSAYQQS